MLFIILDVHCDGFSGYGLFVFTDILIMMIREMLLDCCDIMRTSVSRSKLGVPVVRD